MTSERHNLPRNAAKVEFIAHAETIKSMLNEGYNLRNIYNKLSEFQNFSMSYFTLCHWYRKAIKEVHSKEQIKPKIVPKIPPVPIAPKKLSRPEDVDRNSLF